MATRWSRGSLKVVRDMALNPIVRKPVSDWMVEEAGGMASGGLVGVWTMSDIARMVVETVVIWVLCVLGSRIVLAVGRGSRRTW
jgi:hypothetical protein